MGIVALVALVALVNRWVPVLDVKVAAIAVAACTCAGLLAGLWPAVRAMRIQPVAALQR